MTLNTLIKLICGQIHLARVPAAQWREQLMRMKAGGLNMVAVYVFWIHHEEAQAQFNFTGRYEAFLCSLGPRMPACDRADFLVVSALSTRPNFAICDTFHGVGCDFKPCLHDMFSRSFSLQAECARVHADRWGAEAEGAVAGGAVGSWGVQKRGTPRLGTYSVWPSPLDRPQVHELRQGLVRFHFFISPGSSLVFSFAVPPRLEWVYRALSPRTSTSPSMNPSRSVNPLAP